MTNRGILATERRRANDTSRYDDRRDAGCKGKDPLTAGQARSIMTRMNKNGKPVQMYRCRYCGKWHVGKSSI